MYSYIDLDEKRRQLTRERPLQGVEPTGLWWYAPYCASVSLGPSYKCSRMTYEAQLLLQVQRHGARCGTFSRVKLLEELAPCLGERRRPRDSAAKLTRSHAINCERTVISKDSAGDCGGRVGGNQG